jgi:hypothetical protein
LSENNVVVINQIEEVRYDATSNCSSLIEREAAQGT